MICPDHENLTFPTNRKNAPLSRPRSAKTFFRVVLLTRLVVFAADDQHFRSVGGPVAPRRT